jgi:hypothetical protein
MEYPNKIFYLTRKAGRIGICYFITSTYKNKWLCCCGIRGGNLIINREY